MEVLGRLFTQLGVIEERPDGEERCFGIQIYATSIIITTRQFPVSTSSFWQRFECSLHFTAVPGLLITDLCFVSFCGCTYRQRARSIDLWALLDRWMTVSVWCYRGIFQRVADLKVALNVSFVFDIDA